MRKLDEEVLKGFGCRAPVIFCIQELWLVALVCSWHHKGFGTGLSTVEFEADFSAT